MPGNNNGSIANVSTAPAASSASAASSSSSATSRSTILPIARPGTHVSPPPAQTGSSASAASSSSSGSNIYPNAAASPPRTPKQIAALEKIKKDNLSLIESHIRKGELSPVQNLVERDKVDINSIIDKHDNTLLMLACEYGQTNIIKYLLKNGANPDLPNKHGFTALMFLLGRRNKHADDVDSNNEDSKNEFSEVLKSLLGYTKDGIKIKQIDINVTAKNGTTYLMMAAMHRSLKVVKQILDEGAKPNEMDQNEDTAVLLTASRGRVDILKLLASRGANLHARNKKKKNALFLAFEIDESNIKGLDKINRGKSKKEIMLDYLLSDEVKINITIKDWKKKNILGYLVQDAVKPGAIPREARCAYIIKFIKAGIILKKKDIKIIQFWGNAEMEKQILAEHQIQVKKRQEAAIDLSSDTSDEDNEPAISDGEGETESVDGTREGTQVKKEKSRSNSQLAVLSSQTMASAAAAAASSSSSAPSSSSSAKDLAEIEASRMETEEDNVIEKDKSKDSSKDKEKADSSSSEEEEWDRKGKTPGETLHHVAGLNLNQLAARVSINGAKFSTSENAESEREAYINSRDSRNRTPLMTAVQKGVLANVEYLVLKRFGKQSHIDKNKIRDNILPLLEKVDLNAQDDDGNTALHLAVFKAYKAKKDVKKRQNYIDIIKTFLKNENVDLYLKNNENRRANTVALFKHDDREVYALIHDALSQREAEEERNKDGERDKDISRERELNSASSSAEHSIDSAMKVDDDASRSAEISQSTASNAASTGSNSASNEKNKPKRIRSKNNMSVHKACINHKENPERSERELKRFFQRDKKRPHSKSVNYPDPDSNGMTPLMEVVSEGLYRNIPILLSNGADPNASTDDGHSVLMLAIDMAAKFKFMGKPNQNNSLTLGELGRKANDVTGEIIRENREKQMKVLDALLKAENIDLETPDSEGLTPLKYAESKGDEQIKEVIMNRLYNRRQSSNQISRLDAIYLQDFAETSLRASMAANSSSSAGSSTSAIPSPTTGRSPLLFSVRHGSQHPSRSTGTILQTDIIASPPSRPAQTPLPPLVTSNSNATSNSSAAFNLSASSAIATTSLYPNVYANSTQQISANPSISPVPQSPPAPPNSTVLRPSSATQPPATQPSAIQPPATQSPTSQLSSAVPPATQPHARNESGTQQRPVSSTPPPAGNPSAATLTPSSSTTTTSSSRTSTVANSASSLAASNTSSASNSSGPSSIAVSSYFSEFKAKLEGMDLTDAMNEEAKLKKEEEDRKNRMLIKKARLGEKLERERVAREEAKKLAERLLEIARKKEEEEAEEARLDAALNAEPLKPKLSLFSLEGLNAAAGLNATTSLNSTAGLNAANTNSSASTSASAPSSASTAAAASPPAINIASTPANIAPRTEPPASPIPPSPASSSLLSSSSAPSSAASAAGSNNDTYVNNDDNDDNDNNVDNAENDSDNDTDILDKREEKRTRRLYAPCKGD